MGWGGVKTSCDLRTHVMLRCCYVIGWGLGGVGWGNSVHGLACTRDATLLLRHWLRFVWGGVG